LGFFRVLKKKREEGKGSIGTVARTFKIVPEHEPGREGEKKKKKKKNGGMREERGKRGEEEESLALVLDHFPLAATVLEKEEEKRKKRLPQDGQGPSRKERERRRMPFPVLHLICVRRLGGRGRKKRGTDNGNFATALTLGRKKKRGGKNAE